MTNNTDTKIITKVLQKALNRSFEWGVDPRYRYDHFSVIELRDRAGTGAEIAIEVIFEHKRDNGLCKMHKETFSLPEITDRHSFWKALCGEKKVFSENHHIGKEIGGELLREIEVFVKVLKPVWQHFMTQYHLIPDTDMKARIAYLKEIS